jgi:hypothetical protein
VRAFELRLAGAVLAASVAAGCDSNDPFGCGSDGGDYELTSFEVIAPSDGAAVAGPVAFDFIAQSNMGDTTVQAFASGEESEIFVWGTGDALPTWSPTGGPRQITIDLTAYSTINPGSREEVSIVIDWTPLVAAN